MAGNKKRSINKYWLIVTILFLAAFLRILGIWHGYPYSYYPDEAHFVKRALSFGSFDFNPHWFHKPALYMYILFFEYGLYFLFGKIVGFWGTVSDFAVAYVINPGPFYIIGRLTTVISGLGSIWIVYILGERHFKQEIGIVAALLLSLSYGHVASSQYVKADTPTMFFTITSMFFLLNYLNNDKLKNLIWSAVLAGMGTATKAYSIVMLIPILMCLIIMCRSSVENIKNQIFNIASKTVIVMVVFYATYFVCSPYNFFDPLGRRGTFGGYLLIYEKVLQFFGKEKIVGPGDFIGNQSSLIQGFIDYFQVLFATDGMGIVIGSFAIAGIVYLLTQYNRKVYILLLFPILFLFISVFTYPGYAEPRHQLPLYPFLAIAGGALLVALAGNNEFRKKIVYATLLISLTFPMYKVIERGLYVSRQDTRNMAKVWIESNIPTGTKLLLDENGPQLLMSEKKLKEVAQGASKSDPKGQFTANYDMYLEYQLLAATDSITYDIEEIRFPWWREKEEQSGVYSATTDYDRDMGNPLKPVGAMPYEFYKENDYEYAVVNSEKYGEYFKAGSFKPQSYPSFYRFYNALFEKGTLVKEFQPNQGDFKGPVIKIFKLK